MITYCVMDLGRKKQYYGSTDGSPTDRPYSHLKRSNNKNLRRAVKKRFQDFFVVVGENDGLSSREEEQFYLDFYHGTMWCYNTSPTASGNPKAIRDYNDKVSAGLFPHSRPGTNGSWQKEVNQLRVSSGTHNFLSENVDPDVEVRRLESVRKVMTENNPMKSEKVRDKISLAQTGMKYWVNESGELKRQREQPGPEWQRGMKWK
jgi:hypothetical protein